VKSLFVVVLVAAAALVPVAAAAAQKTHKHRLRLSLVPLQTAQLGPQGASLPLQFDSGTLSNRDVPPPLRKDARVSGYQLDYGVQLSGGAGVTGIETQVEQFRTHAGAKKALAYWKKQDKGAAKLYREVGIDVTARFFKVPAIGSGRFGYDLGLQIPNADPLYLVDEQATSGSFVLHASVSAGTAATAEHLAPVLMSKLVHRVHRLLAGQLHGSPPKMPPFPNPGPPPGGPDLSTFVVGPSDFTGKTTVIDQGYGIDLLALSTYGIDLQPAGPYEDLEQEVSWYANANEATWEGTLFADVFSQGSSGTVDLSAVGDNAHGLLLSGTDQSGNPVHVALVILWQGQAVDLAIGESPATIQPSDVQSLAQAMANHLNAGLAGPLRPHDLDEPAPIPLPVQFDEENALPGAELKLPLAHWH
jgi:hypothetical protein